MAKSAFPSARCQRKPAIPQIPDALYARGVWQDDILPAVSLGEFTTPEIALDLSFMRMGEGQHGPSWLARRRIRVSGIVLQ